MTNIRRKRNLYQFDMSPECNLLIGTPTMLLPLPCFTLSVVLAFCHSRWLSSAAEKAMPLDHVIVHPLLLACCCRWLCCLLIYPSAITCCTATEQWGRQSFATTLHHFAHDAVLLSPPFKISRIVAAWQQKLQCQSHQPWQCNCHCFASLCYRRLIVATRL